VQLTNRQRSRNRAEYQFTLLVVPIVRVANDLTDGLSHDKLSSFFLKVLWSHPKLTPIPPTLPELKLICWKSQLTLRLGCNYTC